MVEPIVKHSFVEVNGSFVHLKQYGHSEKNLLKLPTNQRQQRDQSESSNGNHQDSETKTHLENLVIFVPGNPGALGIYHDFLGELSERVDDTIVAISHNDFDHPDHVSYPTDETIYIDEKDLNFVEKTLAKRYVREPHHIELQILNKLIILRRLLSALDNSVKSITFVGHSIGCYVILRLLQDKQLSSLHSNSILIHPALENLALTEKGQYFDRVFGYRLEVPMRWLAFLLDNLLPQSLKLSLTKRFCGSSELAEYSSGEMMESLMQLACSRHLDALIRMAKSELANVKQLDCEQMIKPHVPKLKFLYAIEDHWVNVSHRRTMRRLFEDDIHIEERDTMHAFVMVPKAVAEYADVVANFMKQQQKQQQATLSA